MAIINGANVNRDEERDKNVFDYLPPVALVVEGNNVEMLRLLISKGADINCIIRGEPVTNFAAQHKYLEVLKCLVTEGNADLKPVGTFHCNIIHTIAGLRNPEVAKLIIDRSDISILQAKDYGGDTPFCYTITAGNYEMYQMLIDKGVNIKSKDRDGFTPIFNAVTDFS